ncbi:MAG: hypothetical protein ACRD1Z_06465 [Vicinamibacteria bacterium]
MLTTRRNLLLVMTLGLISVPVVSRAQSEGAGSYEYRVLATQKTSTMEKELNEAGGEGFRYGHVMGGETSYGGSEVVVVMTRDGAAPAESRYVYKLLATSKTSTMQKELQKAGDEGFECVGQTIFSSTFGGKEVVIIMERDREKPSTSYEYRLVATNKTSTFQKELNQEGPNGFALVGLTVAETSFGGSELVAVLRKEKRR